MRAPELNNQQAGTSGEDLSHLNLGEPDAWGFLNEMDELDQLLQNQITIMKGLLQ